MRYFLYYICIITPLMVYPFTDAILRYLVWKYNRSWAEQRRISQSIWSRKGNGRWTWSLMTFDKNIQVTKAAGLMAFVLGASHYVALVSFILLLVDDRLHFFSAAP